MIQSETYKRNVILEGDIIDPAMVIKWRIDMYISKSELARLG